MFSLHLAGYNEASDGRAHLSFIWSSCTSDNADVPSPARGHCLNASTDISTFVVDMHSVRRISKNRWINLIPHATLAGYSP